MADWRVTHLCRRPAARLGLDSADPGLVALLRLVVKSEVQYLYPAEPILRGLEVASAILAAPQGLRTFIAQHGQHSPHGIGYQQHLQRGQCAGDRQCAAHGDLDRSISTTPLAVNHTGLFPSVHCIVQSGAGSFVDKRRHPARHQMQQRLGTPSTVRGFFAGTAQAYQQSLE